MKLKHFFLIIPLLLLIGIIESYAQEMPNAKNYVLPYYGSNTSDPNDMSNMPSMKQTTQEQIKLQNEIEMLRRADNPDRNKIEQLNRQLDELNGQITLPGTYYPAKVELVEKPVPYLPDNIQNILVYSGSNLHSIATCVETRQGTAGKLWLMLTYRTAGSNPDQARMYYSTTNGQTWVHHSTITLGGTDKFNYEELDMEIIESTSGDKYLWFVWGLRSTAGTGSWFTGAGVYQITGTFTAGFLALSWPGAVGTNRYYNPRITSDNAYWTGAAFTYIAVSFDSVITSGRTNFQKVARCTNPYTTSPSITYRPSRLWWNTSGTNEKYLSTDIAFFIHSSDSLIISYSGIPDSTKLFFAKTNNSFSDLTSAGQYVGFIGGSEANDWKHDTKLSTNGNSNGSVIAIFNQQTGGQNRIKYFRTLNWGNFNSIDGQSVLMGTATGGNSTPDIYGIRNSGTHVIGLYQWTGNCDLRYIRCLTDGSWPTDVSRMNYQTSLTGFYGPRVAYRYVSGDSCFVAFSEVNAPNVWIAYGCSGTILGTSNNQLPVSYSLSQNYPNPFNPKTIITFSIPKTEKVQLVVYDVMGREVSVIVNKVMNQGTYNVEFDASNLASGVYLYKLISGDFVDIKKMILLK